MKTVRGIYKPYICATMGLMSAACISQASAQTISNVAKVEWDFAGQRLQSASNRIDIEVVSSRPEIATYVFSKGNPTRTLPILSGQCHGASGMVPTVLHGAFAGVKTNPAELRSTTEIHANEPLVIVVSRPQANHDPALAESFSVAIRSNANDQETITLTETAPDSGEFAGFINTSSIPPEVVQGDCKLSVRSASQARLSLSYAGAAAEFGSLDLDILIDPFGTVFDSADGSPISGVRVTLIDNATGQPASHVFGDDGISTFPNSIVTGSTVTDSGGTSYSFPQGFYRFPFARPGAYSLRIEPPQPYSAPSTADPAALAELTHADGSPYTIMDASFGDAFMLDDPAPVRVDIPIDRPGTPFALTKSVSASLAAPGDVLQYRIAIRNSDSARSTGAIALTDTLPSAMRLRPATIRYNGAQIDADVNGSGSTFQVTLPPLPGGGGGLLTYLAEVRPDAAPGDAVNRAEATDNRGTTSNVAEAFTRIERDGISERFTIIGRITDGACSVDPRKADGIAGVRVMMEDGSYAVTDRDGRYHFEGVQPGLHVVQVDPSTFPTDQEPYDCAQNTRSAGSAISRFVEGQGGTLKRADFRARTVAPRQTATGNLPARAPVVSDQVAAGAERDWFAGQKAGIGWLFPQADHNPRAKAIRVAIKHLPGQKVELSLNGTSVNPLAFDGERTNGDGSIRVSIWRGIELDRRDNILKAIVRNKDGSVAVTLDRTVHFATTPLRAELLKDKSVLVADGITRPVIAVRLTDRDGVPVHHGLVGDFSVPAPYAPAIEVDAQQAEQLSGLERARPVWRVEGEDGIAYIELEPTTASGTVSVEFTFRDGQTVRRQRVEAWLDPGDHPWTVVGFAAGTVGFNTLDSRIEKLTKDEDDVQVDGRVALYAKGRITGKWLMTLAYDNDKEEDETRFGGVIDPQRYYTIYADRSGQRYDAASVRRLYLKLERPQFYALFGDYETAINEPELARYQRTFNGAKAEFRNERVSAVAFGADTPNRFRREEIQGNGLSGPYALGARDIIANSERIRIEVRDRFRSEQILKVRELTRHIDYDIDYAAGILRFREPILSRVDGFDPQFIVAEYEVDGIGERVLNTGGRATWRDASDRVQLGATFVHDEAEDGKTDLGGIDVRYRPDLQTEIRAEIAISDSETKTANPETGDSTSLAWQVEAAHHGKDVDVLAYVRHREDGFGVGQLSGSENGSRKVGADVRYRAQADLVVKGSAYQEDFLTLNARRRAASGEIEYRTGGTSLRAGLAHAEDALFDGTTNRSTIARLGGSQKLLGGKVELDAQTEFALGGQDESVDFPARHRFIARYTVTRDVKLIGAYEIADGETFTSQTARIGFELAPWAGARIVATGNQQHISEYGPRSFAAFGLSQSFRLGKNWSVDLTLDANETVSGWIDPGDVVNPAQPGASGGFLSSSGALTEDFIAVTAGVTYRSTDWSWATRAEYRAANTGTRYGFTSAALKQVGADSTIAAEISYFHAELDRGPATDTTEIELSWAYRPDASRWSWLNKVEFSEDKVRNAVAGTSGPIGGTTLLIDGNATSRRLVNSLSVNFSPVGALGPLFGKLGMNFAERGEYTLFWGTRYNFEKFGPDDVEGWSNVVGLDVRFDLSSTFDIGAAGTARISTSARSIAYSGGPSIGYTPFENAYISVGYNFVGFHDRDFEESRYTRDGAFVTFRLKFDQESLGSLGL